MEGDRRPVSSDEFEGTHTVRSGKLQGRHARRYRPYYNTHFCAPGWAIAESTHMRRSRRQVRRSFVAADQGDDVPTVLLGAPQRTQARVLHVDDACPSACPARRGAGHQTEAGSADGQVRRGQQINTCHPTDMAPPPIAPPMPTGERGTRTEIARSRRRERDLRQITGPGGRQK